MAVAGRVALAASLTLGVAGAVAFPGVAAAADLGFEGPSSNGATVGSTGSKPQSKAWFNDGAWWAVLYHPASTDFHIFRLDPATQAWVDTGVAADPRPDSRSDVLWDGTSLYIASHVVTTSPASGYPSRLFRYSYNTATDTYSLDAGFPAAINNYRTETLVIDKDSTGTLWATWVQGSTVYVSHTTGSDASWATPFALPVTGTTLTSDDISTLVAFGGNKVGVMWSNQRSGDDAFYFSVHADGSAPGTWIAPETAAQGGLVADDHISLKTDSTGRVYAAVKTSKTTGTDPLELMLVREASGAWSSHQVTTVADGMTRPIVVVDEPAQLARVFLTGPQTPGSGNGESGGAIYEKTAPLVAASFATGPGVQVMRDESSGKLNNATSSKRNVSATTGLAVLAVNDSTMRYWHHFDALAPTPPDASFTATPVNGPAPLAVTFSDTSTGSPTSWSWDFGDAGTSTEQNPSHLYTTPGTYSVSLTASNTSGSDASTQTNLVTVTTPGSSLSFAPVADAYVRSDQRSSNFGSSSQLRVRTGPTSNYRSYLRFSVSGMTGPVASAKLRLNVTDGSTIGGSVHQASDTAWAETGITWGNAPAFGSALSNIGAVTTSTVVEIDVSSIITGNGLFTIVLSGGNTNSAYYASRETTTPPELVVVPAATTPTPPVASFTATPVNGAAPLAVSFSDTSTGSPTSWSWDFGDAGTSTEQNPSHLYTTPGTYSVSLTASNTSGTDTSTQTDLVTVTEPPPPATSFVPVADAYVRSDASSSNFGTASYVRVRTEPTSSYRSYLRFSVSGMTGPVASAKLRLNVTDGSTDGGSVHQASDTTWAETGITWGNAPAFGSALSSIGAVTTGTVVEIDVSSIITGNGLFTIVLAGGNTNSAYYASRETTTPPELVVVPAATTPTPPVASFAASPVNGPAPLAVSFSDTSTGYPTSWSWDFGDAGTSTGQNPSHLYTTPGTYSVSLTASNTSGTDTSTQTDLVTVTEPPPSLSFVPVADAYVRSDASSSNFGTASYVRVRTEPTSSYRSYLRFSVSGMTGPVASAKLRLNVTDGSTDGGSVHQASDTTWAETGITWGNAPAFGSALSSIGAVTTGTVVEIDVSSIITGNGLFTIVLAGGNTNSAYYASRETTTPPELVVVQTGP